MSNKSSKFNLFLLLVFVFFFILIFSRFFSSLSFPDFKDNFKETGETTLFPNKPIHQIFTAEKNNLNQVNVAIKNFNDWSRDKIIFNLKDENCKTILASDKINVFSPDYTIYTPFTFSSSFSKISENQEMKLCAEIIFIPKNNTEESDFPTIVYSSLKNSSFINTGDIEAEQFRNNKTLVMKPAYGSGSFWKDIETLNNRISQYKPWFLKHYFLYFIIFSFIILLVFLVIILVIL